MLKHVVGTITLLVVVLGINGPVRATFRWELTEPPAGTNMMQFGIWADAGSAQLTTPITSGVANTSFSNFGGNLSDGSQVTISSLAGLNGFSNVANLVGQDLSNPLGFAVAEFTGGITLPMNATSPANALPVLNVTYTADRIGTLDGLINDPVSGAFDSTVINGSTDNVAGSSGPTTLSAIPEPSSFALVGLMGIAGCGIVRLARWMRGTKSA